MIVTIIIHDHHNNILRLGVRSVLQMRKWRSMEVKQFPKPVLFVVHHTINYVTTILAWFENCLKLWFPKRSQNIFCTIIYSSIPHPYTQSSQLKGQYSYGCISSLMCIYKIHITSWIKSLLFLFSYPLFQSCLFFKEPTGKMFWKQGVS